MGNVTSISYWKQLVALEKKSKQPWTLNTPHVTDEELVAMVEIGVVTEQQMLHFINCNNCYERFREVHEKSQRLTP